MAQQNSMLQSHGLNQRKLTELSLNATVWKLWLRRYHTRKQLHALSQQDPERLLRDLGLHAAAVQTECKKWFWQA